MNWIYLSLYTAVAALFYWRLAATATANAIAPKHTRPLHWHRTRRMTASFLRRVRPASHKH